MNYVDKRRFALTLGEMSIYYKIKSALSKEDFKARTMLDMYSDRSYSKEMEQIIKRRNMSENKLKEITKSEANHLILRGACLGRPTNRNISDKPQLKN